LTDENARFIRPGSGNIAHGVATATENKSRQTKTLDITDAVGMAIHAEVKATQPVARQTVTATLQDHGLGLVVSHDVLDDGLEDGLVGLVGDTIAEWVVDSVVLTGTDADVTKFACSREVLSVLVERHSHDSVGRVEGLLDAITVVDIDVDVEDALLETEQLQDTKNNV
jgi:hypothetical protein